MPAQYIVISETEDKTFVLPKCKYTVSVKQFHMFSGKFSAGPKLIIAGQPLLYVGENNCSTTPAYYCKIYFCSLVQV